MLELFKIKPLFVGMLLAAPPIAAWMSRNPDFQLQTGHLTTETTPAQTTVQIPVEIVATGSASQIFYVEVPAEAASGPPENEPRAVFALGSRRLAP